MVPESDSGGGSTETWRDVGNPARFPCIGHGDCTARRALLITFTVDGWLARVRALVLAVTLVTVAGSARGQTAPSQDTSPATIDTGRGPITGSTRFIGLGGAFVAIAEDSEGVAMNPASTAVRLPWSFTQWDYGWGVDVAIGAWLPKNKFYNQPADSSGVRSSTALFGSVAVDVFCGHFGLGVSAEAQRNAATRSDQALGISTDLAANFGMVHANMAYGFYDGQLAIGAGPRLVGVSFSRQSGSASPLSSAGVGYEAAIIVKPAASQYRLSTVVKSPIDAKIPADGGGPDSTIHVPWELGLGAAYQFGKRPLNPRFVTVDETARQNNGGREPTKADLKQAEDELFARYERSERFYLLVSGELTVLEGASGHLGFDQYWDEGGHQPISGVILSPRVGVESEVVPRILKLRAGSYYEPPLVGGVTGRFHGTGGLDVRLFEWNIFGLIGRFDYWQLSLAADAARQYLNTAVSIGFWH